MTGVAEIFVGLLLAVAVLALVARKLTIPYRCVLQNVPIQSVLR